MKSLLRNLVAVLMVVCAFLPACSSGGGNDVSAENLKNEALFSEDSQYSNIAHLLGNMTQEDLWNVARILIENLDSAARVGQATEADAKALKEMITQLYKWMGSDDVMGSVNELAHGPVVELLDMMVKNRVGNVAEDFINAAGSDVLVANVYPMLAYLVSLDTTTLSNAVSGINIKDISLDTSKISEDDFEAAATAMNGIFTMAQEGGKYNDVYTQLTALYDVVKESDEVSSFTVGDLKDLMPGVPLVDLKVGNVGLYADVINTLAELMEEDDQIKDDASKLLHAAGYLMANSRTGNTYNSWDSATGSMTDLERVMLCLRDGLAPDGTTAQTRTNLKNLINKLLNSTEYLEGADNVYGLTSAIASIDPDTDYINDLRGIDNALYQQMMQMNMYSQATAASTVKASELQTVLVMMNGFWGVSDAIDSMGLTSAITSLIRWDSGGPAVSRKSDLAEWLIGALVEPMYAYPTSYHNGYILDSSSSDSIARPYPDPLKGLDWLMYDENITVLYFLTFANGLDQIVDLGALNVIDYLLSAVDASGISNSVFGGNMACLTESLEAVAPLIGASGSKYSTGNYHRLMSVAAPVLRHYYEQGYASELVHVLADLNEVNIKTYKSLATGGTSATYRLATRNTALEQVMGPSGYGMMYYLLRGQSDAVANNNEDILDPTLDLMVRVLYKLRNTPYGDSNMLRAVCDDLVSRGTDLADQADVDVDQLVEDLFAKDGPVDQLYTFLNDNHGPIAKIGVSLGKVIMAAVDQSDNSKNIFKTDDLMGLVQDILQGANGQTSLGTVLTVEVPKADASGQKEYAVSQIVGNLLVQSGIKDDDLITTAKAFTSALCSHGVDICTDLGTVIPVASGLVSGLNINGDYDFSLDDLQPVIDYLTEDVNGAENPFVFNLKALGYKAGGFYDAIYNPNGTMQLNDATPLVDLADHLIGDKGLYDVNPLLDFLGDLTDKKGEALIRWLEVGQDIASEDLWDTITGLINPDSDFTISTNFIKALFVSYNGNDSLVLAILKLIHLEYQGQPVDCNGVLNDINTFIKSTEFQSGSQFFDTIYQVLGVVIDSFYA